MHVSMHQEPYICVYTRHIKMCFSMHTYMHAYMHTHTPTYIHTYMHAWNYEDLLSMYLGTYSYVCFRVPICMHLHNNNHNNNNYNYFFYYYYSDSNRNDSERRSI